MAALSHEANSRLAMGEELGWVNPLKEEGGKLQAFAISGSRDDGCLPCKSRLRCAVRGG
jgi:hypothetical protein